MEQERAPPVQCYVKKCLSGLLLVIFTLGLAEGAALLGHYDTNQVSLTAGFIPDSTRIIIGEPLFLTFVLSNRADRPSSDSKCPNSASASRTGGDANSIVNSRYGANRSTIPVNVPS